MLVIGMRYDVTHSPSFYTRLLDATAFYNIDTTADHIYSPDIISIHTPASLYVY